MRHQRVAELFCKQKTTLASRRKKIKPTDLEIVINDTGLT
jgi:hypothetical protein